MCTFWGELMDNSSLFVYGDKSVFLHLSLSLSLKVHTGYVSNRPTCLQIADLHHLAWAYSYRQTYCTTGAVQQCLVFVGVSTIRLCEMYISYIDGHFIITCCTAVLSTVNGHSRASEFNKTTQVEV